MAETSRRDAEGGMSARDITICKAIADGLGIALKRHLYFAGERGEIRPEYLSTVSIAEQLLPPPSAGEIPFNETGHRLYFEQPTDKVLNYLTHLRDRPGNAFSMRESWLKQPDATKKTSRRPRLKDFRRGLIDIVYQSQLGGQGGTTDALSIHCIEVKNINPTTGGIKADLKRLFDIVAHGDGIPRASVTGWLALLTTDKSKADKDILTARILDRENQLHLDCPSAFWYGPFSTDRDCEDAGPSVYVGVVRIGKALSPGCQLGGG